MALREIKSPKLPFFKYDGDQIVDEFTSLVNPQCPIPYFITGLTGIDDDMVKDAPTFQEISRSIQEITNGCVFVAHAVNFDYGVIKEEFRQNWCGFHPKKTLYRPPIPKTDSRADIPTVWANSAQRFKFH